VTTPLSRSSTRVLVITLYSTAANAQAATVPIAYSAVDMPASPARSRETKPKLIRSRRLRTGVTVAAAVHAAVYAAIRASLVAITIGGFPSSRLPCRCGLAPAPVDSGPSSIERKSGRTRREAPSVEAA
jgi:hypothetical protein